MRTALEAIIKEAEDAGEPDDSRGSLFHSIDRIGQLAKAALKDEGALQAAVGEWAAAELEMRAGEPGRHERRHEAALRTEAAEKALRALTSP